MEDFPKLTRLQRAQRVADFARTIPMTWVDSERFAEADLSSVLGLIEARYRVNTPEAFLIVRTMTPGLSEAMLKSAGVKDMTSCFLIAVRSLLGDAFPEIITDEGAAEILRLNEQFQSGSEQCGVEIEAVYRNNVCERTGQVFRFEDWIDQSEAEPVEFVEADYAEPIFKGDLALLFGVDRVTIKRRIEKGELKVLPGTPPGAQKVRVHCDDFLPGLKRKHERTLKLFELKKDTKRQ